MSLFKTFAIKVSFLFIVSTAVWAQTTTATISGTVKDETGGVIPGVSVTVISQEMGTTRTAVTDDIGYFQMPRLAVGLYNLRAELSGFQTSIVKGISLQIGREVVINPILRVGEISQMVTVTGETALVDTTSSTVAALVDDKLIRDLPLNGRSFTQLALLQEGIVTARNAGGSQLGNEGQKISINGTRISQTSFLLDGTEIRNHNNTTAGSVAGVLLGVDTVREFSVITSVASAEFGRFTGGVVNAVTRSGTNELHGSVFEFHRNSALDARNFFDPGESPSPFKRNQFGFTIGGPIRQNKTFFFGSYEALRDRLSTSSHGLVPDADAHRGILPEHLGGNVGVDPGVQPYLDTFPLPNGPNLGNGSGSYFFTNPQPINEHYFMTKIDHSFSDSDSLFARYTFDQARKTRVESMELWTFWSRNLSQYFTLEEKHIFSPTLLNVARVSFNRNAGADGHDPNQIPDLPESMKFIPLPGRGFGYIRTPGLDTWGPTAWFGSNVILNRFEYADTLVFTKGQHSVKFGANIARLQYNFLQTSRSRGIYQFQNLANFLQGRVQSFESIYGDYITQGMRESLVAFFIQDDYRMTSNLTWNLGLRYEFITNPKEVAGRFGNLDNPMDTQIRVGNPMFPKNPSLKNYAPRLGFAWSPFGNGKTSLRGGAGIFHDLIQPVNYYAWPQANVPFYPRATLRAPSFPDAFTSLPDPSSLIPGLWVTLQPEQSTITQYNLTLQQEILPETVLSVGYSGSHGTHLSHFADANTARPEYVNGRPFFPPDAERRNPNFSQIRAFHWDANSFYNAFKVGLRRRFSDGLQLQSSYTYGRSIDDSSNQTSYDGVGGIHSLFADDHKSSRGLSWFDVRHNWVVNGTYELPFGPGKPLGGNLNGFAGKLIGGWQLGGIMTLSTGNPINLLISFERSNNQATVDIVERPSLKPGANNNPVLSGGRDPNKYYDPSVFTVAEAGFFGDLARNTLIGPGVQTVDFSLTKNTSVGETATVQFRAELFNVLNRANFAGLTGRGANTVFRSPAGVPSATVGRIRSTSTTGRQIQFALKILF